MTGNEEKDLAKVKADYVMLVKDVEDMESLTKHVELIVKNWKFQMKIEKQRREVT